MAMDSAYLKAGLTGTTLQKSDGFDFKVAKKRENGSFEVDWTLSDVKVPFLWPGNITHVKWNLADVKFSSGREAQFPWQDSITFLSIICIHFKWLGFSPISGRAEVLPFLWTGLAIAALSFPTPTPLWNLSFLSCHPGWLSSTSTWWRALPDSRTVIIWTSWELGGYNRQDFGSDEASLSGPIWIQLARVWLNLPASSQNIVRSFGASKAGFPLFFCTDPRERLSCQWWPLSVWPSEVMRLVDDMGHLR